MSSRPRTYAAITRYSLEHLPQRLRKKRLGLGLSVNAAAPLIGISRPTLTRVEATGDAHTETLIKVFAWLDGGKPEN